MKSFEPVNVEKHKPGKIVVKVGDKEMTFMADPATEIDAGVKPGVKVDVAYGQAEDVLVAESVKVAKQPVAPQVPITPGCPSPRASKGAPTGESRLLPLDPRALRDLSCAEDPKKGAWQPYFAANRLKTRVYEE